MDWGVWVEIYENGVKVKSTVWQQRFKRKGNAIRAAMKYLDRTIVDERHGITYTYKWIVSRENPWEK